MNYTRVLPLVLVVLLSGCGSKKKQKAHRNKNQHDIEMNTNVDIPVSDEVKSFFDGDVDQFAMATDDVNSMNTNVDMGKNSLAWADETASKGFKKIYFDFDGYTIREDQKDNLDYNIAVAKKMLEESTLVGKASPMIMIDGHADSSAGSRVYNLALSEKRGKVLSDAFVRSGVPANCVRIVGHGSELPAVLNGKAVSGDREAQWPNRRDEIRIIYS